MSATRIKAAVGSGTVAAFMLAGSGLAGAQGLKRGQEFPNFSEPDMRTGKTIELKSFRGKVVLIDFWATWCGPCKAEIPNVKKAYEKYHKDGFEIISISLDQKVDACKSYVEENKMDWHHICDGKAWDAKLAKKHGIEAIPKAVLIGRDGKIISVAARGAELTRALEEGLKHKVEAEKDDEIDTKAKVELAKADKLREQGKYNEALKVYDELGTKYAARPTGKLANERARELREDPKVSQQLESGKQEQFDKEAQKDSEQWLKVARQMAKDGQNDLARQYYQKVIDKYPKSKYAKTAEQEVKKLSK